MRSARRNSYARDRLEGRIDALESGLRALLDGLAEIRRMVAADARQGDPATPDPDRWLDARELRRYLGGRGSEATFYRWRTEGGLPSKKIGNLRLYRASDVDAWLSRRNEEEIEAERLRDAAMDRHIERLRQR